MPLASANMSASVQACKVHKNSAECWSQAPKIFSRRCKNTALQEKPFIIGYPPFAVVLSMSLVPFQLTDKDARGYNEAGFSDNNPHDSGGSFER
jgi:hypothetical protein